MIVDRINNSILIIFSDYFCMKLGVWSSWSFGRKNIQELHCDHRSLLDFEEFCVQR